MTHTPTPYYVIEEPRLKRSFDVRIVDVQDVTVAVVPQQPLDTWRAYDTAENMVKAVNSHDALVSALEAVRDSGMFDWEGEVAYEAEAKQVADALALAQEVRA
jgi:hypothetical protein